jgi:hypothetical protein
MLKAARIAGKLEGKEAGKPQAGETLVVAKPPSFQAGKQGSWKARMLGRRETIVFF